MLDDKRFIFGSIQMHPFSPVYIITDIIARMLTLRPLMKEARPDRFGGPRRHSLSKLLGYFSIISVE